VLVILVPLRYLRQKPQPPILDPHTAHSLPTHPLPVGHQFLPRLYLAPMLHPPTPWLLVPSAVACDSGYYPYPQFRLGLFLIMNRPLYYNTTEFLGTSHVLYIVE